MSEQAVKPKSKPKTRKPFKFSQTSLENMKGVNKILVQLAHKALARSKSDFGIIKNGGLRTAEMQNELYRKGNSNLDGYILISHHQLGNALDLVPYVGGKYTWSNNKAFEDINKAVLEAWKEMNIRGVQLDWGGNWKNPYDPAHYQIKNKR